MTRRGCQGYRINRRNCFWNKDLHIDDLDDDVLEALADVTNIEMPEGQYSVVDKEKLGETSLELLPRRDLDVNDVDDPTLQTLANLGNIPMPKSDILVDHDEKTYMLPELDDPSIAALSLLTSMAMLRGSPSRNDKKKKLDDALEWLRNNSLDPNDIDDIKMEAIVNLPGISIDIGPVSKEDKKNLVADGILLRWMTSMI
jgi:hypothetical protein